jgi:hypothetical protein
MGSVPHFCRRRSTSADTWKNLDCSSTVERSFSSVEGMNVLVMRLLHSVRKTTTIAVFVTEASISFGGRHILRAPPQRRALNVRERNLAFVSRNEQMQVER